MPTKSAALYLRVSSLDQHPETQLYDLQQLASQRGYEVVKTYTEKLSGAKARKPAWDSLLADARGRKFDLIMVGSLSDVACSVKQCLSVLDQLNQIGIGFVSCQPDIDTTGELGQGIAATVRALSLLQRTLVGEAVKAGMRRSRPGGGSVGARATERKPRGDR